MPMIYALRHKETGYAYIGCTKGNMAKRMREHRCLLNAGRHLCTKLQNDWDKHGKSAFEIVKLEELGSEASVVDKRARELYWMQVYQDKLYNLYQVSFAPIPSAIEKGVKNAHNKPGNRWTPEANEKRRQSQLGIPKGHGAKISATKRKNKCV